MNEHQENAGSSQPSVLGKVTFADGKPAVGFRVRALDCDLRVERQVGAATTNATGAYEISYSVVPHDALTKPAADLRVQVLDAEGAALLTSVLHPAAAPRLVVDLRLERSAPEASEYEQLVEALAPRLSGVELADLSSEDIAYLASVTGQDTRRIERLAASARLAGALNGGLDEPIPGGVVYALLREGLPAQAEALARVSQQRVKEALERAVANHVIAPPSEPARQVLAAAGSRSRRSNLTAEDPSATTDWQDDIAVVLREKRVERELVPSASGEHLTVADLFASPQSPEETLALRAPAARLSDEKLRRLAELVAVDEPGLRQDWEKLHDQGFEAWEVGLVRRGYALAELTQDHLPLVRALQDLGPVSPDAPSGTLRYLAQLTDEDWQARVAETGVPARVEGIDEETRRGAYAAALEGSVETAFPTAVVAERVRQDRFAVESDLKTDLVGFFDGNPDFEFGKQYVQVVLGDGGEARTEGVADVDRLRQTLLGMERVIKITGNYREHSALLAYGFDSAHKVVLSNRRSFVDTMRTHPDVGAEAAAAIYDRAEHTTAVAATLLMRYRDPGINLPVLARTDLSANAADEATRAALREIPDLRTLFGSLDRCACEACLSVLSPAAYFVDLMRFLEGSVANPGYGYGLSDFPAIVDFFESDNGEAAPQVPAGVITARDSRQASASDDDIVDRLSEESNLPEESESISRASIRYVHEPVSHATKLAIVSTIRDPDTSFPDWVQYHINLGFRHLYVFLDKTASSHPNIPACPELHVFPSADIRVQGGGINRLLHIANANVLTALQLAKRDGIKWLMHIDGDELLYSPKPLGGFLLELERLGYAQAWLENHEAIAQDGESHSPFRDRKIFKKLGKMPFQYHAEGKSIAQVDKIRGITWTHFFHVNGQTMRPKSRENIATPCILHYPTPDYPRWLKKYTELGHFVDYYWSKPEWTVNQTIYLKSRDIFLKAQQTGDWTATRKFFQSTLLSNGEISRHIRNGDAFALNLEAWLDSLPPHHTTGSQL